MDFESAYQINLQDEKQIEDKFLNAKECYQEFKIERFRSEIDWSLIPEGKEEEFTDQIKEFILEILHQAKYYLPLDDDYVNLWKVLEPENFDRKMWINLADKLKNLVPEESFQSLLMNLISSKALSLRL